MGSLDMLDRRTPVLLLQYEVILVLVLSLKLDRVQLIAFLKIILW